MPFKKGDIPNPKGSPKGGMPGAGRPLEWFRQACREALSRSKSLERMEALASFQEFPQLATSDGQVLMLPPPIREWRASVEWLANYGYGKPEQPIELKQSNDDRPTTEVLIQTLTVLRSELDGLRKGTEMAAGK